MAYTGLILSDTDLTRLGVLFATSTSCQLKKFYLNPDKQVCSEAVIATEESSYFTVYRDFELPLPRLILIF